MKNGGYHIVDFGDVNIVTGTASVIAGIYESIEGSHRKQIMISGVTLDGVEQRDCFVDCEVNESNYTFSAYGKTWTITSGDSVTATAAA